MVAREKVDWHGRINNKIGGSKMGKKTTFLKRVRAVLGFKGPKSVGVGIYARVSTDEQALNLDEQRDHLARYISRT